jgi:hypothetical protein
LYEPPAQLAQQTLQMHVGPAQGSQAGFVSSQHWADAERAEQEPPVLHGTMQLLSSSQVPASLTAPESPEQEARFFSRQHFEPAVAQRWQVLPLH